VTGTHLDSVAEPYIYLTVFTATGTNDVTMYTAESSSEVDPLIVYSLKTLPVD